MSIALYSVLGQSTRVITFAVGAAWTLLMSVAVVGTLWHTPLDAVGSVFLSVGFVTAGAAILGPKRRTPAPPVEDRARAGHGGGLTQVRELLRLPRQTSEEVRDRSNLR